MRGLHLCIMGVDSADRIGSVCFFSVLLSAIELSHIQLCDADSIAMLLRVLQGVCFAAIPLWVLLSQCDSAVILFHNLLYEAISRRVTIGDG